ncbi:MAG: small multi-drug export protein [Bacillota bacterium]|nr:small multi-drug export protein [Bacillota bacterium]
MSEFLVLIQKELSVFILSMVPISELRGAIPYGISIGLSPYNAFVISVIGNIIPVPFLLKLYRPIIRWIARSTFLKRPASMIVKKVDRSSQKVRKYELFGLFLLVAIPLPTTGVWTASAVASFLKLSYRKSIFFISLGVLAAGLIVLSISVGISIL